jgi:hypothetical protein
MRGTKPFIEKKQWAILCVKNVKFGGDFFLIMANEEEGLNHGQ